MQQSRNFFPQSCPETQRPLRMLAARTGAAGTQIPEENPKLRKQSGLPGSKDKPARRATESVRDGARGPSSQSQLRARQLAQAREVEMNLYLQLHELSTEHTTAHTTGMWHR